MRDVGLIRDFNY